MASTDSTPLKAAEAAAALGVRRSLIYKLLASGTLPALRVAGAVRIDRADLAWLPLTPPITERTIAPCVLGCRSWLPCCWLERERDGISYVTRFRSAASAAADVTHFVASHPDCTTALELDSFKVTAIPGSHGIAATRSDGEGYDIVFADGVFSYDVGAFTTDPKGPPTRSDVIRAATRLYTRVRGHPARS